MTPTDRDLQILDHVHRYRLTTRDILQRQFFPIADKSAVSKVITRLVADDWLRECRLESGFAYYVLGRRGRQAVGASLRSGRQFTEQTLPAAYGCLAWCTSHGLHRLTAAEFQRAFPELLRPRMKTGSYVVDATRSPCRLGAVLLDRGNPPKYLLHKLDRLRAQHYRMRAFFELIQSGRFWITILTAWPAKQRYLASAVKLTVRGLMQIEVVTVPELQSFFRRI